MRWSVFRSCATAWARTLGGGKKWHVVRREWRINCTIGVVVSLGLHVLGHYSYFVTLKSLALDKSMTFDATVFPRHGKKVPPLVAIDVDEETWRDPLWGERGPVRAPRKRLLQLINYALDKNARYVVVDVIVEGEDAENGEFKKDIEQVLPRLKMCESVKDCKPGKDCPCVVVDHCHCAPKSDQHVLFVRTLLHATKTDPVPLWRPSPLDDIIDRPSVPRLLHAVAPYFVVSRDGLIREWTLWQVGCRTTPQPSTTHWQVLPSVQVVIASLLYATPGVDPVPWETVGRGVSCDHRLPVPAPVRPEEADLDRDISGAETKAVGREIDGFLRTWLAGALGPRGFGAEEWESAAPELKSRILFKYRDWSRPDLIGHLSAREIISRRPYPTVTKNDAIVPDPTVMEDGVVVIGQSFEEARDSHQTPVGMMSGPLVILNSIDSMISPGVIRELPLPADLALEIAVIGLIGFAFARLRSADRAVRWLSFLLVPMLIAGCYLLLVFGGRWWDNALPSLSIGVHRAIEFLRHRFKTWRQRHPQIPEASR